MSTQKQELQVARGRVKFLESRLSECENNLRDARRVIGRAQNDLDQMDKRFSQSLTDPQKKLDWIMKQVDVRIGSTGEGNISMMGGNTKPNPERSAEALDILFSQK